MFRPFTHSRFAPIMIFSAVFHRLSPDKAQDFVVERLAAAGIETRFHFVNGIAYPFPYFEWLSQRLKVPFLCPGFECRRFGQRDLLSTPVFLLFPLFPSMPISRVDSLANRSVDSIRIY
jgi:hypothetical protein